MEHFSHTLKGYCNFTSFYKWVADQLPKDQPSRCVEIGVHSGQSAAFLAVEIFNKGIPAKLDLIDTFTNGWIGNRPGILADMNRIFAPLRSVVDQIIPSDSSTAASLYEDKSVDFIFIDGDHQYEGVKKDIVAWKPKMKSGSIMAGHDYCHYDWAVGIIRAVCEEFDQWHVVRGDRFYGNDEAEKKILGPEGQYHPVWWVRIP